jgi:hypothetical protein
LNGRSNMLAAEDDEGCCFCDADKLVNADECKADDVGVGDGDVVLVGDNGCGTANGAVCTSLIVRLCRFITPLAAIPMLVLAVIADDEDAVPESAGASIDRKARSSLGRCADTIVLALLRPSTTKTGFS